MLCCYLCLSWAQGKQKFTWTTDPKGHVYIVVIDRLWSTFYFYFFYFFKVIIDCSKDNWWQLKMHSLVRLWASKVWGDTGRFSKIIEDFISFDLYKNPPRSSNIKARSLSKMFEGPSKAWQEFKILDLDWDLWGS